MKGDGGQIGVDETLFWVSYVLPDIARLEDRAQIQEFKGWQPRTGWRA